MLGPVDLCQMMLVRRTALSGRIMIYLAVLLRACNTAMVPSAGFGMFFDTLRLEGTLMSMWIAVYDFTCLA